VLCPERPHIAASTGRGSFSPTEISTSAGSGQRAATANKSSPRFAGHRHMSATQQPTRDNPAQLAETDHHHHQSMRFPSFKARIPIGDDRPWPV